jgi:hypothetical protein
MKKSPNVQPLKMSHYKALSHKFAKFLSDLKISFLTLNRMAKDGNDLAVVFRGFMLNKG